MTDSNDAKHALSPKNIFWIALSIALLMIVGYNIYSGRTVSGIDVPGVMNVQFDQPAGTRTATEQSPPTGAVITQAETENLKQTEIEAQQARLQAKIEELEKKLQAKNQITSNNEASVTEIPSSRYNLSGTWIGVDGIRYRITQSGNEITFQEINPVLGVTIVADGEITGNQIELDYTSMLGTTGSGTLTIGGNGESLRGTFHDDVVGAATAISLSR